MRYQGERDQVPLFGIRDPKGKILPETVCSNFNELVQYMGGVRKLLNDVGVEGKGYEYVELEAEVKGYTTYLLDSIKSDHDKWRGLMNLADGGVRAAHQIGYDRGYEDGYKAAKAGFVYDDPKLTGGKDGDRDRASEKETSDGGVRPKELSYQVRPDEGGSIHEVGDNTPDT